MQVTHAPAGAPWRIRDNVIDMRDATGTADAGQDTPISLGTDISTHTTNGSVSSGNVLTVTSTVGNASVIGAEVTGHANIPANTYITGKTGTTFVLSKDITGTIGTGVTITCKTLWNVDVIVEDNRLFAGPQFWFRMPNFGKALKSIILRRNKGDATGLGVLAGSSPVYELMQISENYDNQNGNLLTFDVNDAGVTVSDVTSWP
jgi:hypothetical protein